MIEDGDGNLIEADVEALVNTVNTVGAMGKGLALQFKQAFPDNFAAYARAVKKAEVQTGRMFVYPTGSVTNPRFIVNFPTKSHWRGKSKMADIEAGLVALVEEIRRNGICSIAVPPLGCGNGGLDWDAVRPRIEATLGELPDLRVLLFAPRGAPAADQMPIRTRPAVMTTARALLVKLMEPYTTPESRLTLLEIQQLAYFLQESGEPLHLRYVAGHFGPFAPKLNKVLERIEGHLIRGYGDSQKPDVEIGLLDGAVEAADALLVSEPESRERLDRVIDVVAGFETPHGMELLSSVHWVAKLDANVKSAAAAVRGVHAWNARKQRMFSDEDICGAWNHLVKRGWVGIHATATAKPRRVTS